MANHRFPTRRPNYRALYKAIAPAQSIKPPTGNVIGNVHGHSRGPALWRWPRPEPQPPVIGGKNAISLAPAIRARVAEIERAANGKASYLDMDAAFCALAARDVLLRRIWDFGFQAL